MAREQGDRKFHADFLAEYGINPGDETACWPDDYEARRRIQVERSRRAEEILKRRRRKRRG